MIDVITLYSALHLTAISIIHLYTGVRILFSHVQLLFLVSANKILSLSAMDNYRIPLNDVHLKLVLSKFIIKIVH